MRILLLIALCAAGAMAESLGFHEWSVVINNKYVPRDLITLAVIDPSGWGVQSSSVLLRTGGTRGILYIPLLPSEPVSSISISVFFDGAPPGIFTTPLSFWAITSPPPAFGPDGEFFGRADLYADAGGSGFYGVDYPKYHWDPTNNYGWWNIGTLLNDAALTQANSGASVFAVGVALDHEVVWAELPEPSTFALLALPGLLLWWRRRIGV